MSAPRRLTGVVAALLVASACTTSPPTPAPVSLDVMSSGGFAAAYEALAPGFVQTSGIRLDTAYGASMGGAPDSIPMRLERGEPADVVILSRDGLSRLVEEGLVVEASTVNLAESVIGMAVRAGEPVPDIGTVEAFVRTLLEAESIAYSASVSGTYVSTELFPRLGVAERLADRSIRVVSERVGAVVARGDAAIGFQQVSELLPIPGLHYVGEIPAELQKRTVFSAGITTRARAPEAAVALLDHLTSLRAEPTIRETGLRPLTLPPGGTEE